MQNAPLNFIHKNSLSLKGFIKYRLRKHHLIPKNIKVVNTNNKEVHYFTLNTKKTLSLKYILSKSLPKQYFVVKTYDRKDHTLVTVYTREGENEIESYSES